MKRKSFAKRNALISVGTRPFALIAVALVALVVVIRIALPGLLVSLVSPLWRASAAASGAAGDAAAALRNPVALSQKLDAANAENATLADENAALTAKVQDLTALLGSRAASAPLILAGVLARPPVSPYDSLVIDEGTAGGVKPSAAVYGPGGTPVGVVASVADASARVTLYTAPGATNNAWVGDARLPLTLTGEGGGAWSATADVDAGIATGDLVYMAGPGAIPVGTVVRVDTDASSPTATLRIESALNPFSLTWVTVAKATP